tara:strand:- start:406 stop:1014 length:609 start_codon:yes stop_codon:yes gene_type:complete
MRIISGELKGKILISPDNDMIRPTSDRGKEVIFDTLTSILYKQDKEYKEIDILDIFCGTGSLGIEAISRGGKSISFIDNSETAINLTRMNCEKLKINNVNLLNYNFFDINLSIIKQADVIFLDPPYKMYDPSEILRMLLTKNLLKINGILIFETSVRNKLQDFKELKLIKKKEFLSLHIIFLLKFNYFLPNSFSISFNFNST